MARRIWIRAGEVEKGCRGGGVRSSRWGSKVVEVESQNKSLGITPTLSRDVAERTPIKIPAM
jgi:hypothetical protein